MTSRQQTLFVVVVLLLFCFYLYWRDHSFEPHGFIKHRPMNERIVHLDDVDKTPISHDAQLMKRVLVGKGRVQHLAQWSHISIPAGAKASQNVHNTMTEIFYCVGGRGSMHVVAADGSQEDIGLTKDTLVVVEPLEHHAIYAAADQPLHLMFIGITKEP